MKNRPEVDILQVSTGESWPGTRAIERKLVDEIITSDDYLLSQRDDADIFEIKYVPKKNLSQWLGSSAQRVFDKLQQL